MHAQKARKGSAGQWAVSLKMGPPVVLGCMALHVTPSAARRAQASMQLSRGDVAMDSPLVLYIDDLPQALELRKNALESHGYSVKIASSGHTAMKLLQDAPVAAVLLEYKQEGMDAEAVAWLIKQRFPNLPIILLSAYSEMPERILWLVDEYVMKSELPERLGPIIERVHSRPPGSNEQCQRSRAAA